MKAEQSQNKKHTPLSPATWCAGLTLSLAAIGFTGCENKTREITKTKPYEDMGEGVFLITSEGPVGDSPRLNVPPNLATWKKDYPDRQINLIIPVRGDLLSEGLLIDTVEKPSAPTK